MIDKEITCIECPLGCRLKVEVENCKVVATRGQKCPKGEIYAAAEVENPTRILTTTIRSHNLTLKMVPVRTDKPIPKSRIFEAMEVIRKASLEKPMAAGEMVIPDILGLGVNVITTREVLL